MTNTFISKVQAEREILAVVNRAYAGELQLSGLSSCAIEYWRAQVSLPANHPLIESLVALAAMTQTLSNRSNQSFVPLDPSVLPEIRRRTLELQYAVTAARSEG